ncbi:MAG: hypothetical protein ACOX7R_10390 [Acetivibrionales bacterium]|jgi:hypothetical protein
MEKRTEKVLRRTRALLDDSLSSSKNSGPGSKERLYLEFTRNNVLNGIIFSEILGRPKCKRK